jgi:predicted glutamine amidotransferase
VVASEPTDDEPGWQDVEDGTVITLTTDTELSTESALSLDGRISIR